MINVWNDSVWTQICLYNENEASLIAAFGEKGYNQNCFALEEVTWSKLGAENVYDKINDNCNEEFDSSTTEY